MSPLSSDDEAWGFARHLLAREVPEVATGVVEVRAVARIPGYRTKIAVSSVDPAVDPIQACVGEEQNRIQDIGERLSGEAIDLILWTDSPLDLIEGALTPAWVRHVQLNPQRQVATVTVARDQLDAALGPDGQNRELASRLSGWDIQLVPSDAA